MKQKILVMLLAAAMALSCAFSFAACTETPTADSDPVVTPGDDETPTTPGGENPTTPGGEEPDTPEVPHTHTFASDWTFDTTSHWHRATCSHADAVSGQEKHTYGDWTQIRAATCTRQGLRAHTCTACGYEEQQAVRTLSHEYAGDTCTVCGSYNPAFFEEHASQGLLFDPLNGTISGLGTCTDTEIVIPMTYGGLQITGIVTNVFSENTSITSVIIPDTVETIGSYAFAGCTNLRHVTIGNGVTQISRGAFANTALTEIELPDSLTAIDGSAFEHTPLFNDESNWENGVFYVGEHLLQADPDTLSGACVIRDGTRTISDYAFSVCTALTSVTIPDSVESIGYSAFEGCTGLTEIAMGSGVATVDDFAFTGCTALEKVSISDLAAWCKISFDLVDSNPLNYAHHLCLNGQPLTELVIPGGIEEIGWNQFKGCTDLVSVTIPDSVNRIRKDAFSGCSELKELSLGYGLTTIELYAFAYCEKLPSVAIPESVTTIGGYAFTDCFQLAEIGLPDSVTSLDGLAFEDTAYWNDESNWEDGALYLGNHLLRVNADEASGEFVVREGTRTIAGGAFRECSALTSIVLPEGLVVIGESAFENCFRLTEIVIPESVTLIGMLAFHWCTDLTQITISGGVRTIGQNAFDGCYALERVTFAQTQGWCEDTWQGWLAIDVSDPARNAELLRLGSNVWERTE